MINFSNVKEITIPEGAVLRILSGNTSLWMHSMLPASYQQVEYIATNGNQYINTGVLASNYPDGCEYTFRGNMTGITVTNNNNYFFGALANGQRSGNISYDPRLVTRPLVLYLGATSVSIKNAALTFGEDFTIFLRTVGRDGTSAAGLIAKLNDINMNASNTLDTADMPDANIFLFHANGVATANGKYWGKLYSFIMNTLDGTPIRNFVPCYRKADGEIGLYDTVGGVFYTNSGSGTFSKGPDVPA